ncbi:MAG: hypothetical protein IJ911_10760 [Salinivirgaceae bacterium]|nr:hypothetical protein [Salinivirgaceae bacterium]
MTDYPMRQSAKYYQMQVVHRIYKVIVAVAFTIGAQAVSAQSCQFEKNAIDAITETQVKVTQPVTVAKLNNNPLYFKAQSVGSKYRFLKMRYYKYNNFSIDESREISLRLTTNEEIVIYPRHAAGDTIRSTVESSSAMLIYPISAEQYEKLKRYPVTTFKYFVSTGFIEVPIKENKQTKIMGILNCID